MMERVSSCPTGIRLVLDTSVVLSALLFRNGRLSWVRRTWQSGQIVPVVCRETVDELLHVLAYPKFHLERADIDELLADFMPYAEAADAAAIPDDMPQCRDPKDRIFIRLLLAAKVDALISGDADLADLARSIALPIWTPAMLQARIAEISRD